MRWLLHLAAGLFLGCPSTALNNTTADPLRVEGNLDFGGVFVGASKRLTLTVSNPNRTTREVELQLSVPFAGSQSLSVGGGESVALEVAFTPLIAGRAETTFMLDATEVAAAGEGLAPLGCPAPDPCSTTRFDAEAGECVTTALPEDGACVAPCVVNGHCRSGLCLGAFDACDDQDPCTADGCSQQVGCQHAAASCADPADPCQAALCDRQSGCALAPVTDGVYCGPDDCVRGTADVCINGRCVARARPAGQLCFETLVGVAGGPGVVDGRGVGARFFSNRVLTVDRFGNVVVFDRAAIRRVTSGGVVSTLVNYDVTAQIRDGVGTAGLVRASTASVDAWGDVLFVDGDGACVREVSSRGSVRTLNPGCTLQGVTAVVRTLDRRVWIIAQQVLSELRVDGSLVRVQSLASRDARLGAGGGPLLFNDGSEVFVLGLDAGGPVAVGTLPSLAYLWGLHENGALYSRATDAGCEHGFAQFDGGTTPRFFTPPAGINTCFEAQDNVSTFTGSKVLNLVATADGGLWGMERGTLLVKYEDGGSTFVAGAADRAAFTDGFGPDAGLNVTAGFGISREVYDSLAITAPGRVLMSDSLGTKIRSWDDDAGLVTLARNLSSGGFSRSLDGGLWMIASTYSLDAGVRVGLHHFDPETRQLSFSAPLRPAPDSGWEGASWLITHSQPAITETADSIVLLHRDGFLLRFDGQFQNDLFFETQNSPMVDGFLPDAGLEEPGAPLFTGAGEVTFVDGNAIRRLSGGVLTTIAGAAQPGYVDAPGRMARFNQPLGLALHPNGDLVVADTENNVIRAISPMGMVRTLGRLTDRPSAVAVAPNGDVYVLVRHALLRGR